jgi:hypothetical protein
VAEALTLARARPTRPSVAVRNGRLVRRAGVDGDANAGAEPSRSIPQVPAVRISAGSKAALLAFVAALFMPTLYSLGSINLSPALLYLIIGFAPLLGLWAAGRAGTRTLPDMLVLAFAFWAAITRLMLRDAKAARAACWCATRRRRGWRSARRWRSWC